MASDQGMLEDLILNTHHWFRRSWPMSSHAEATSYTGSATESIASSSTSTAAAAALKRARTDPLGSRPERSRGGRRSGDGTDSSEALGSSSSSNGGGGGSSQSSLGPSTSRGPPTATTTTDSRAAKLSQTGLVHSIPIKMVGGSRRRAESLDSGSDRIGGGAGAGSEHDPHPTPMTISEWQTPALSRRPSVGMHFHESSSSRIQKAPTPGQERHRRDHSLDKARLPPPDYLTSPTLQNGVHDRFVGCRERRLHCSVEIRISIENFYICFNQGGLSCPAGGHGFNGHGYPPMAGRYNYLLNQSRQAPRRQLSRRVDADWLWPMNGRVLRKARRVSSN